MAKTPVTQKQLDSIFPIETEEAPQFEYYILLNGKKGRGRKRITHANTTEQATIRAELAGIREFGKDSFIIHHVSCLGFVEAKA